MSDIDLDAIRASLDVRATTSAFRIGGQAREDMLALLTEVERLRRAAAVTDASWQTLAATVDAVRALTDESRRTGRRLSALDVIDALDGAS